MGFVEEKKHAYNTPFTYDSVFNIFNPNNLHYGNLNNSLI